MVYNLRWDVTKTNLAQHGADVMDDDMLILVFLETGSLRSQRKKKKFFRFTLPYLICTTL